ncbi:unnamed protein product [Camellia sinensis]
MRKENLKSKAVAYRIEDVINEYILLHLAKQQPQCCGFIIRYFRKVTHLITRLKQRHEIASQIQDIKITIGEIKEQADRYKFSTTDSEQSSSTKDDNWHDPRLALLYLEKDEVVGLEYATDKLINKLLEEQSQREVISVVGMAGVGKTPLAKKVYDSQQVNAHFDCKAWFSISQSYKPDEILKTMIKKLSEKEVPLDKGIDSMDQKSLMDKLREYLKEKRYVIVFDDVWKTDFWEFIRFALPENSKGSRVIITTRSDEVAALSVAPSMQNDYSISCGRLIRLWIAEGLVEERKGNTLEEMGELPKKPLLEGGIGGLEELQSLWFVETNDGLIKELEKLSVWASGADEILDLQYISSPPQYLPRLELVGHLEKLPEWIPKLQNLVTLLLLGSGLTKNDPLKALQELPSLVRLVLSDAYDGKQLYFEVGRKRFRKHVIYPRDPFNSDSAEKEPSPHLKEVPPGIHHLTNLKTLEFVDMPEEFIDRMEPKPNQGKDYWIVEHIPHVLLWYRIGKQISKISSLEEYFNRKVKNARVREDENENLKVECQFNQLS